MYKLCKSFLKVALIGLMCKNVAATGMAVGLDNLFIQNNTNKQLDLKINNLPKDKRELIVKPNSICRVSQGIVFFPTNSENNSFAIMLKNSGNMNAIVIDKDGRLALASNAKLKFNYQGNVKNDGLFGYCDIKLQQSKYLKVNPESVKDSLPVFKLNDCNTSSNFVYVVSNKKIKEQKKLNLQKIDKCNTNN